MKSDVLKQYIALSKALHEEKAHLEARLHELNQILGPGTTGAAPAPAGERKRTISAAGRARIVAAQKARWARYNAGKKPAPKKTGRRMSASAKARIAAAQRARWARFRAARGG
jgi:hypothetical protein